MLLCEQRFFGFKYRVQRDNLPVDTWVRPSNCRLYFLSATPPAQNIKFDDGDEDEENKSTSASKTVERGYFRTFLRALATVGICLCALIAATAMSIICFLLSIVLWLRGLGSIIHWVQWKMSDKGKSGSGETTHRGYPTAMPGQEHGSSWRHAWEHVAKTQNFRLRHEHESEHFHVAPLLQSMSGLDMERLCFLTMKKHNNLQVVASGEKGAREKSGEPDEPDPEAAGGYMFPVQVRAEL